MFLQLPVQVIVDAGSS